LSVKRLFCFDRNRQTTSKIEHISAGWRPPGGCLAGGKFLTNGGGVLQPPPSRPSDAAANMSSSRERGLGSVQTKEKKGHNAKIL